MIGIFTISEEAKAALMEAAVKALNAQVEGE
jgi:hypothetical protein